MGAEPRPIAATPVRLTSTCPSSRINPMKVSIFDALPVISNTKCSVEVSTTCARINLRHSKRLNALVALSGNFHQGEFAFERYALARQIAHAVEGTSRSS